MIRGNPDSDNLHVVIYNVNNSKEVFTATVYMLDIDGELVKFWYHVNDVLHVEEHHYNKDKYKISIQ